VVVVVGIVVPLAVLPSLGRVTYGFVPPELLAGLPAGVVVVALFVVVVAELEKVFADDGEGVENLEGGAPPARPVVVPADPEKEDGALVVVVPLELLASFPAEEEEEEEKVVEVGWVGSVETGAGLGVGEEEEEAAVVAFAITVAEEVEPVAACLRLNPHFVQKARVPL
jgi:hypothetical protein